MLEHASLLAYNKILANNLDKKLFKKGTNVFESCETWKVVINIEDQYSIWPTFKAVPEGWKKEGKEGTKEECLNYIKEVWTDMRPRSLKELMKKAQTEAA